MYKPPSEDEQPRNNTGDGAVTDSSSRIPPRQSAAQHKPTVKQHKKFYTDEHPEIPKVRRASLQQARAEMLPFTSLETADETLTQSSETESYTPEAPNHELDTTKQEKLARNTRSSQKISAHTSERRPAVSSSPQRQTSNKTHTRHANRPSAPFFGRKQSWLLIGLLALVILVVAPLLTNLFHNANTTLQNKKANNTTQNMQPSVSSNAHELVIVPPDSDHPAPPLYATSAFLLDADNEMALYAQNPFLHLPMLSTTKLMTATLAVENGNLDQQITITATMEQAINQLSADSALFGVKQGETYTLRDLLYGLLYVSGNDAALVIADALAGNMPAFVAQMNQKAQELGLHDTHFVNPHGLLDAGQYSCARDLAILGQYSLSNPVIQQISSGKTYHIPAGGNHGDRVIINENQFLWWYPGVNGGKTGYDGLSDFVQVMSVTRNNRHMIGVVMHTNDWWTDMRNLMDYGSNDYTWTSPHNVEASGQPIPYDNLWNYFASDTQQKTVPTADKGLYYIYTGYSISGSILSYFNQKGGLKTFGFPLKMPVPSGGTIMSQQFQHGAIQCDLSTNQCQII